MRQPPRILITGFGRFPGMPVNPSAALADMLARSRRSGLPSPQLLVLPTRWATAQHFADELERRAPDIVLMIGVAARRRHICIERRAVNVTGGFPDTTRNRPVTRVIDPSAPHAVCAAARLAPALHALRLAGVPARISRDAGRYICNALAFPAYLWANADGRRIALFVHIPRPRAGLTLRAMARALEALLIELRRDQAARQRSLRAAPRR